MSSHKAFISSTGRDLAEYRHAAIDVCNTLQIIPVAMEYWESQGSGATRLSLDQLTTCDVFVGFFAYRYGYVEVGYQKSVTECEFDEAETQGIDRLCFVMDDNFPWPMSRVEGKQLLKQEEFKARVQKLAPVTFGSIEDFKHKVYVSLSSWLNRSQKTRMVHDQPRWAPNLEASRLSVSNCRVVNTPPGTVPDHFQSREEQSRLLCRFLKEDGVRMISVLGRGGAGKTTLVCRTLQRLSTFKRHDAEDAPEIRAIFYLSARGRGRLTVGQMFDAAVQVIPLNLASQLKAIQRQPTQSIRNKTEQLLHLMPQEPTVIYIDNLEDEIDPLTGDLFDADLTEALSTLIVSPQHNIRLIITSRVVPRRLSLLQPQSQRRIDLAKGLDSTATKKLLLSMDRDCSLGLADSDLHSLDRVYQLTQGNPRAIESLFALLAVDRHVSLDDVISSQSHQLPENVTSALIGESYLRLDEVSQRILQALAVYNRPVSLKAVVYLLYPENGMEDLTRRVNHLHGCYLIQKEQGLYSLHPVDRDFVLSAIDVNTLQGTNTQSLRRRAADYFLSEMTSPASWRNLTDMSDVLARLELLFAAMDWQTAFRLLIDIDFDHLWQRGYYRLMISLHQQLQSGLTDPGLLNVSLGRMAHAMNWASDEEHARKCYHLASEHARRCGDKANYSRWQVGIADCCNSLGDFDTAIQHAVLGLDLARETCLSEIESRAQYILGIARLGRGEIVAALACFQVSARILQVCGNEGSQSEQLRNTGLCYAFLGDANEAQKKYLEALSLDERQNNRTQLCILLYRFAALHIRRGGEEIDVAISQLEKCIRISDEIGLRQSQIEARHLLALCRLLLKDFSTALQIMRDCSNIQHPRLDPVTIMYLGICETLTGQVQSAKLSFNKAILGARALLGRCDQNIQAMATLALAICGSAHTGEAINQSELNTVIEQIRGIGPNAGAWTDLCQVYHLLQKFGPEVSVGADLFVDNTERQTREDGSGEEQLITNYYCIAANEYERRVIPAFAQFATAVVKRADPRGFEVTLDAGTGTGILGRLIAPHVRSVIGIDATQAMVEAAKSILISKPVPNLTFEVGDLNSLAIECDRFDLVVASFGLNGCNPKMVFSELFRVIRPGGQFTFIEWGATPHDFDLIIHHALDYWASERSEATSDFQRVNTAMAFMDRWSREFPNAEAYRSILQNTGFIDISIKTGQLVDCALGVEGFLDYKLSWPNHRLLLQSLPDAARAACLAQLRRDLLPYVQDDNLLHYTPEVHAITSRKSTQVNK